MDENEAVESALDYADDTNLQFPESLRHKYQHCQNHKTTCRIGWGSWRDKRGSAEEQGGKTRGSHKNRCHIDCLYVTSPTHTISQTVNAMNFSFAIKYS